MLNKKNTDYFNKILLVAITLLLIEVTFFHSRVIFFGTFSIVCIYFGRKKLPSFFGKILFWLGCISLTITVMTMFTFKFIILAIIVYVFIQFVQSKQKPLHITPTILETPQENQMEPILKRKPLFENVLFGSKQTPDRVYEWNDINLQTGIGDTIIDLSNTVLPKGEAVISVRNFIGNVRILVPYEIEVSILHSVITGYTEVFEHKEERVFNQLLQYETEHFVEAEQKVKIITSMILGNLEVKRI